MKSIIFIWKCSQRTRLPVMQELDYYDVLCYLTKTAVLHICTRTCWLEWKYIGSTQTRRHPVCKIHLYPESFQRFESVVFYCYGQFLTWLGIEHKAGSMLMSRVTVNSATTGRWHHLARLPPPNKYSTDGWKTELLWKALLPRLRSWLCWAKGDWRRSKATPITNSSAGKSYREQAGFYVRCIWGTKKKEYIKKIISHGGSKEEAAALKWGGAGSPSLRWGSGGRRTAVAAAARLSPSSSAPPRPEEEPEVERLQIHRAPTLPPYFPPAGRSYSLYFSFGLDQKIK